MSIFNIKYYALLTYSSSILILGLVPASAIAVSLDLFEDTNANSTFIPAFGVSVDYDGQQAELNGSEIVGTPLKPPSDVDRDADEPSPDTELSGVIGTQRTVSVSSNSGSGLINLTVDPDNGQVSFNVNSGTNGSASILWDGITAAEEDLTVGGTQNSFLISVINIDNSGTTLNFKVTDEFGNSGTLSNFVADPGNALFAYDSAMQDSGNSANVSFTDVRSVEFFTSNEPDALDFTFDVVETAVSATIPFEFSPSLGIILSASLFGLNILYKKIKSNNRSLVKFSK